MSGLVIEWLGDLVIILISFELGDVLFIDEIYCLLRVIEEILYLVMEDYCLDIVIGIGLIVCFVCLDLLLFILIGVIIWVGFLLVLFRDCFGVIDYLEFYIEE